MSTPDDLDRAFDERSKSTFGDLRRRLEQDRPEGCDAVEAGLTALATGAREPEAERHAATCARCRDRVDGVRDVWRRLEWPTSNALRVRKPSSTSANGPTR